MSTEEEEKAAAIKEWTDTPPPWREMVYAALDEAYDRSSAQAALFALAFLAGDAREPIDAPICRCSGTTERHYVGQWHERCSSMRGAQ